MTGHFNFVCVPELTPLLVWKEFADNWENYLFSFTICLFIAWEDWLDTVQVKWSLFEENVLTREVGDRHRFQLLGSTQARENAGDGDPRSSPAIYHICTCDHPKGAWSVLQVWTRYTFSPERHYYCNASVPNSVRSNHVNFLATSGLSLQLDL